MERFVYESGTGICIYQHFDTIFYFLIILTGKCLHHDTHRPYHIITDVWTTNSLTSFTFKKIRIILT